MTIKASEIITDALEMLVVQREEAEIPQSEARSAIRFLNDMMFAWDAEGVTLGFTQVENMGSEITVALGAIQGIKANLALALAPVYEVDVSPALALKAKKGYMTCVDIAVTIGPSAFPPTLPQGSGQYDSTFANNTFFPDEEGTILTESGGSIALEENTEESS